MSLKKLMIFGGGSPPPIPIGQIFLNPFDSGDYTIVGSASPVFNGGTSITLSGGAAELNDYIIYNNFISNRNHLRQTIRFTVDVFNSTSYGTGVKYLSIGAPGAIFNNNGIGVTSDNSEEGKIYWSGTTLAGSDGTPFVDSFTSVIPVNLGDYMELIMEQENLGYTCTYYNLTLDPGRTSPATLFYQMLTAYPFNIGIAHNTAKNALLAFGGIHTIDYWEGFTNESEFCDLAIIGDSKTAGYGCDTVLDRYGALWQAANPTKKISIFSGSSDRSVEIVQCNSEYTRSKPKKAILFFLRNDIDTSVPSGTWQANYQSVVATLEATGTDVWHQLPTPESTLDQSAATTWLLATYPGKTMSVPTGWNEVTDNVDGIHPNTGGHLKIYNNQASFISL